MARVKNVRIGVIVVSLGVALAVIALPSAATAATVADGPINLGSATPFGVLAGSAVTNTGPTIVNGELGVSPGTAISGFPPGTSGIVHPTDSVAQQAKADLLTAYNVAASLTPTTQGLGDLAGLSLTPGVYSGGELSLNGTLTLAGTATSVWVFQAASTLITGSASHVVLTGGASACNVFWKVGSSATLASATDFVGTVMAQQSITAVTGATVQGRLLASTGAVTLDTNVITTPTACADATGTLISSSDSPEVTSAAPTDATVGTPYSFTLVSSGTPAPSYVISSGALPAGLSLDSATGVISGTPTTAGTATFTVTASNEVGSPQNSIYSIATAAAAAAAAPAPAPSPVVLDVPAATLPNTGTNALPLVAVGAVLFVVGSVMITRRRAHRH
ncbi:ice-binding family protein [Lacisediminihabitans changchengi]|uniref:DUF3494 domain-containing protein n=1 Tax=Lacisediminihabitans changchengi TaxID=2787634 RepID=A0A934SPP2_9MICO|nr:ice-binding family protein [Lacisediminihabitans changchengi]MBK4348942.1 DUF3494 domain-containing protein [Lacisediminihabitans changchengi]